ncbi:hypothetical protein EsDP_00004224 [Epichloe bromicola]|uniref:DUF1740-domain-containing protein n=1 Tax=Epichloe bromicola TaxID=79588 RepID=A0ABQ0CR23_9HYPO
MADSSGVDESKLAVPKFSSFKTKEPVAPTKPQDSKAKNGERRSSSDGHRSDKHHRSSHHHKHGHESFHSRRHHEGSSRRRHKSPEPVSGKTLSESTTSSLFVIDTKGDPLISKYGGIDRAQIPSYYRHGGGRVLGTTGRLLIHRDGARDQFSLRFPGEGLGLSDRDGLRSKSLRFRGDPIRIRANRRATDGNKELDSGFLQIERSKKRKQSQEQSDYSGDEGPSYRSIEGKAKTRTFDDESGETSSEEEEGEEEAIKIEEENPLKWKSIQLNRRVKDHPGDIDAWLELVDHQDDLQRAGESIDERTAASTAHSFSEIKVSMLESALKNTSASEDRQAVMVRLMREGMKIWPVKTAAKRWSELAGDEEANFELWRAHIDFAMTNIAVMSYDDIKQMLLDRLRKVFARSPTPTKNDYSEATYVFLRAMRFVHDCGYKELAVASWQALLEMNFFRPPHPEGDVDSFRDFWESEAPRIGDIQAQGWVHYVSSLGHVDAPEPQTASPTEHTSTGDVYKTWACCERRQGEAARMPARTMDDGTEDDPFRVVMFSDIEPWLFPIPESCLDEPMREELIDAYLIFCGLPPRSRSSKWTQLACSDQFTFRSALLANDTPDKATEIENGENVQRKTPKFDAENGCFVMSPTVLFSGNSWFSYFSMNLDSLAVDMVWVFNTLKQLVHLADVQSLALYYLGFTHRFNSSAMKKSAKAVLKKYSNAAEAYNGFALAEFANGNPDVAERVISSAVESPSLSAGASGFQFFKSWSWIELEKGNKLMATVRLCSAIDESFRHSTTEIKDITPTVVLKARQTLESRIHQALYEGRSEDASTLAEFMVLWSYLTEGGCVEPASAEQGNISASMRVMESVSAEFSSAGCGDTPGHERLLQFGARVLYLNAGRGAYLRDRLSGFLERFPRNTIFLALVEWADSSLRVVDETRQLLYDRILIKGRDCITSRLFSIQHDLVRGNIHSTRAAYEYALSSDVCKFNVGLWISYVRFCYQRKEFRSKVKDVFYRALRHCPWSKEIMMEAFSTVIRDMKSDELRSVYDTMASKGLRVHLDLEEYVEQWRRDRTMAR